MDGNFLILLVMHLNLLIRLLKLRLERCLKDGLLFQRRRVYFLACKCWDLQPSVTPFRGDGWPSLASEGTRHACSEQTYIKADTHTQNIFGGKKIKDLQLWVDFASHRWRLCLFLCFVLWFCLFVTSQMQVQWCSLSLGASWVHHMCLLFASSHSSVSRGSSRYQIVMPELEGQYMLTGSWAKPQPLHAREAHPDLQIGVCLPVNCYVHDLSLLCHGLHTENSLVTESQHWAWN